MGREIEVDAICDGEEILIPGIMEHLERAGIHSGDSTSIYPSINISQDNKDKILEYTTILAKELQEIGMINIQYIEFENELYIIEVNPRSSRTVPYISKVTDVPIIAIATRIMLGEKLSDMPWGHGLYPEIQNRYAVKVPVFSTEKLPLVEVSLGPEMRSTGEVLGVGATIEEALYKGFAAAGNKLPKKNGMVLATVQKHDIEEFIQVAKRFEACGYTFIATKGTAEKLQENGIESEIVGKISSKSPNILDVIRSGKVDILINTPTKGNDSHRDGFRIRRSAIEASLLVVTSLDTVRAMLDIIEKGMTVEAAQIYDMGTFTNKQ